MERVSSEDSRFQRREVREAAYLRPRSLGGGGNTPCSIVWIDLVSLDVLRGTIPFMRPELLPSMGVVGVFGVPG